ncbi:MAG TPA: CHRD domain-containing protein [Anaerolineales bacterium]|nr:CHRD domain-containing protein [Anaerolineales bacterium]
MIKKVRPLTAAVIITLLTLAVAVTGLAQARLPLEDPIPEPIKTGPLEISLEQVAAGMTAPNWGTFAPGCSSLSSRLFLVDQVGILWNLNLATGAKSDMLDVSARLVPLGAFGPGTFDERGFLGVAFHPDYAANGLLYTYTSEPVSGPADFSTIPPGGIPNNQIVVAEWNTPNPCSAASVVNPASRRELMRIDDPQFNHNAGALVFGPDGMLYIAIGDGGAADDQGFGHVEGGNAQNPSNIFGNILRIDPTGSNSANGKYGIPADNPFVGMPGFLGEIFAYGFRNPFRFSFDSLSGEMYIGDVGQNDIEEVSLGAAGGNYGWNIKEGSFCFDPNGTSPGFVFDCAPGDAPDGLIEPIAEYDHDEGISVIGGFVYRGSRIPQLKGRYVFGDFNDPSGGGRLFYLQQNNRILEFQIAGQDSFGLSLLGFGQDADGEIYALANAGGVPFGETGVVLRIGPSSGRTDNFQAHLSGAEENPPVDTQAQGEATFMFNEDTTQLDFNLIAANIDNVVASHIHCAPAGVNGSVGVTLFSGGPVTPNGPLASGSVSAPDAGNRCSWTTLQDVLTAIETGNAYANVHTTAFPGGEIRGQIR